MIELRKATVADVEDLELRAEDAREVTFGWRHRIIEQLSNTYAALDGDRAVALFGVVEGERELGPWLLCSSDIARHQAALIRYARRLVAMLRKDSRLAFNYIPKDSHGNRRFVERLGFRILPSPGDGPDFFYLPKHV